MKIIENFNDEKNLELIKTFSKKKHKETFGNLFDRLHVKSFLIDSINDKLAKIYFNEQNNYLYIMDLGKYYKKYSSLDITEYLKKYNQDAFNETAKFLEKEVSIVTPNTFFFISNIPFNKWLTQDSLIQQLLDSYPCYNLVTYTDEPINNQEIDKSNETHTYSYSSNVHDITKWYYNFIDRPVKFGRNSLIRIARYPDLLEIYDDYRNKTIPMLFPLNNPLEEKKEYQGKGIKVTLNGYKQDLVAGGVYFTSAIGSSCEAILYPEVDFDTFYDIESSFDLFKVYEGVKVYYLNDQCYQTLYFYSFQAKKENIFSQKKEYVNGTNIPEDRMISDIYSIIPIRYHDGLLLKSSESLENNFVVNNLFTGLNFQENYEFGNENANVNAYSSRIQRFDLGTVKIFLTEEPHYNYYRKTKALLLEEEPINIRIAVAVDTETHSGVLYLLHLGIKGKPSKYLDEVARNGLVMPYDENDSFMDNLSFKETDDGVKYVSFYKYLNNRFKIQRLGTARHLILSPFLSDEAQVCEDLLKKDPKADLEKVHNQYKEIKSCFLYSKALFDEGEELGKIVDSDLDKIYEKKWGISVYDYSTIYVSKCTVLQYADTYKDYLAERIDFAVVNLFYLELIQLADASVQNATHNISEFINGYKIEGVKLSKKIKKANNDAVLEQLDAIQEEYAKTLDLWNIQTNYLSSKAVVQKMKEQFDIESGEQNLERVRQEIQNIYQSKQNKISNRTGKFVGLFGVLLALPDMISIYMSVSSNVKEQQESSQGMPLNEANFLQALGGVNILRIALVILLLYYGIKMIIEHSHHKKVK